MTHESHANLSVLLLALANPVYCSLTSCPKAYVIVLPAPAQPQTATSLCRWGHSRQGFDGARAGYKP
jgi:hypothetical protein